MLADVIQHVAPTAQIVSVYNKVTRGYDYFMVPRGVRLRQNEPVEKRGVYGEALEDLLPLLPKTSFYIGRGYSARGRVVAKRNGGGTSLGAVLAALLDKIEP